MKAVGIVVEYNPFHNGHLYHLQQSKKITNRDFVVAVMSGHFLQRGEPALLDKWTRTEMALRGGCDLVIELPVAYATQAAEWFGFGAMQLLHATGIVDRICFGSESGNIESLQQLAGHLAVESETFQTLLRQQLRTGIAYPQAYSAAVQHFSPLDTTSLDLTMPNNTLGLHYLIALQRLQSSIQPFTITREKAGYNDAIASDDAIASATAIRKMLFANETIAPYVPASTQSLIENYLSSGHTFGQWPQFASQLFHQLATHTATQLANYYDVSEGLEHRLKSISNSIDSNSVDQLIDQLKTKRYTRTKLQRMLLAILLGHQKSQLHPQWLRTGIQYIRVLGFTTRGQQLLRAMRKQAQLSVIVSAAHNDQQYEALALDVQASSAYMVGQGKSIGDAIRKEYQKSPIMVPTD